MGPLYFPHLRDEELDIREINFQRLPRKPVSEPGTGFVIPGSHTTALTIPSAQVNGNIYELVTPVRSYSDGR